jgi:hypothetical protein
MLYIDLNQYGLRVYDFSVVYDTVYKDIVSDLFEYEIFHDFNARRQDTKKVYYYHITKQLCDMVSQAKTNNRIVIYYSDSGISCDFAECTNKRTRKGIERDKRSEFLLFINRYFKQIKSILPLRVYISPVKFNTFIQYYNTNKGKYTEIINLMKRDQKSTLNMSKFKSFVDKYKLTYLNKHYVDNIRIKSMLYK